MKCIGDKCEKYFQSDCYYWCYLHKEHINKGKDCPIEVFIENSRNQLEETINLKYTICSL